MLIDHRIRNPGTGRKSSSTIRLAVSLMVLCCSGTLSESVAEAQATLDCVSAYNFEGMKVYLDDLELYGLSDDEHERIQNHLALLEWRLSQKIKIEQPSVDLFRCKGRKPKSSYFQPKVVGRLNERDVLLEVWGRVFSNPEKPESWQAQVEYALIPVRFHSNDDKIPGLYSLSPREVEDASFLMKIADSAETRAYLSAAFGIKSWKRQDLDVAVAHLCRAVIILKELKQTEAASDQSHLADFLEKLAVKAMRRVIATRPSSKFHLLDEPLVCPGDGNEP